MPPKNSNNNNNKKPPQKRPREPQPETAAESSTKPRGSWGNTTEREPITLEGMLNFDN